MVAVATNSLSNMHTDREPEAPGFRSRRARGMGYTAFGETYGPNTTTTVEQRYTYTGREASLVGGPMYYRYRMYDAAVGRFTARDPIYHRGGVNLYGYVFSSPMNYLDSFGTKSEAYAYVSKPSEYGYFGVYMGDAIGDVFGTYIDIRFHPSDKAKKCCDKIDWIQIVNTRGRRSSRLDAPWHVDDKLSDDKPYYRDPADEDGKHQTSPWTKGSFPDYAELSDNPGGVANVLQDFESCAVCREGAWAGVIFGCVTWGHTSDDKKVSARWGDPGDDDEGEKIKTEPKTPSSRFRDTIADDTKEVPPATPKECDFEGTTELMSEK